MEKVALVMLLLSTLTSQASAKECRTMKLPPIGVASTPAAAKARTLGPSTHVHIIVNAPVAQVFAYFVAEDVLPKVLKQYGPIPAALGTQNVTDPTWSHPGANRDISFSDGSTAHEEIKRFEPPGYFEYEVSRFQKNPLEDLAHRALGVAQFTALPGGRTRIDWTYSFEPKSAPAAVADWAFVHTFWHGFMNQALGLMKNQIEHPAATPPATASR